MNPLLSVTGLSKHYDGLRAVHNVDFDLPEGQIRALIGPNGAGKTTFVSLLSGRVMPSHGKISFDGEDITHLPNHKRIAKGIGYTFQITSIFPDLTVSQSVTLAARRHLPRHEVKAAVRQVLQDVGLFELRDQVAQDLSYGHQRLLELAMGVVQRPKLLILDEPTQGLADSEIDEFNALIRELAKTTTVLFIEHNMKVVMEIADFITVLNFGDVLFEGTPKEVKANAAVQAAYLGRSA